MLLPAGETIEQPISNQAGSSSEATVLVQIMHNLLNNIKSITIFKTSFIYCKQ